MKLRLYTDKKCRNAMARYANAFNAPFPCYMVGADWSPDELVELIDYVIERGLRQSDLMPDEIEFFNVQDEYFERFGDTVGAFEQFNPMLPEERLDVMRKCIERGAPWDIFSESDIPEDAII